MPIFLKIFFFTITESSRLSGDEGYAQADDSECDSNETYTLPSCYMPTLSCKESSETSTYKIGGHKDGVGSVACFGNSLDTRTLITQLKALQTDVYEYDGKDESYVCVAEEPCRQPCHNLNGCPYDTEALHSIAGNVFAYTTRHQCSCHTANAEIAYCIATRMERFVGKMKGKTRPECQHTAKAESRTYGVETNTWVVNENLHDALHESNV